MPDSYEPKTWRILPRVLSKKSGRFLLPLQDCRSCCTEEPRSRFILAIALPSILIFSELSRSTRRR